MCFYTQFYIKYIYNLNSVSLINKIWCLFLITLHQTIFFSEWILTFTEMQSLNPPTVMTQIHLIVSD